MNEQLTQREADYLTWFRYEPHRIFTNFGLEMVSERYLILDPDVQGHYCLSAYGADMLDRFNLLNNPLPDGPKSLDVGSVGIRS